MRSAIKPAIVLFFAGLSRAATPLGFSVPGEQQGPWTQLFSAVGFQSQPAAGANVFVLRAGSQPSRQWTERVQSGTFLVLEGQSPTAEMFGFRSGTENIRVGSIQDVHRPKLPIIWQKALELRRFEVPKTAIVFARERWSGAPIMAGFRQGAGAVLWVAASPGERGYERFPYILQALSDLGLQAPFRSSRIWAFFDYSYRMRVDLDYFAGKWRTAGIAALHVASWHFYEPNAERDQYLRHLIEACHRKGVLVYAWLELPHVSEKFWDEHPEWREKTAVLQDAHLDWRKLMNLTNRDCFRAAASGIEALINRFDWDGVNLSELYFESLEGSGNAARFTPMNDDVRALFKQAKGFDPTDIWAARKGDASALRAFLDFRADLARRMQEEWLAEVEKNRRSHPNLDVVLTHIDDRFDTGMKDALGADAGRVLPLLNSHDFTFLIEDPATVWHLGPQRYPEIAKRYAPLTRRADKLAIDINVVDRYQDVYPTKQQTGTELFQLVHLASRAFPRVALYFENSLLPPDLTLLPAAAAVVNRVEKVGPKLIVDSPHGVSLRWGGPALVDGNLWPLADAFAVQLPSGSHSIEPAAAPAPVHVIDFNGDLKSAQILPKGGIELSYQSSSRALAILDRKPLDLEIDGERAELQMAGPFTMSLPRGQHLITVHTQ